MNDIKKIHILCLIEAPGGELKSFLERFELKVDYTIVPYEEYSIAFVDTLEKGVEVKTSLANCAIVVLSNDVSHAAALANNLSGVMSLTHVEKGYLNHLVSTLLGKKEGETTHGESFVISGHLGAGHYGDLLAYHAHQAGFNHLAIRSYFIEISNYFAYLRDSGFLTYPLEVNYEISETFELELNFSSSQFYVDLLLSSMKERSLENPYQHLFGESLKLTHLLEIYWKKRYEQVTFRLLWWKEKGLSSALIVREVETYQKKVFSRVSDSISELDESESGAVNLPGIRPKLEKKQLRVSSSKFKMLRDEIIRIPGGTAKIDDALVWVRSHPESNLAKLTDEEFRSLVESVNDADTLKEVEESFSKERDTVGENREKREQLLGEIRQEARRRAKAFYNQNILNNEIIRVKGENQKYDPNQDKIVIPGTPSLEEFETKFVGRVEEIISKADGESVPLGSMFDQINAEIDLDIELPGVDMSSLAEQIINASMAKVVDEDLSETQVVVDIIVDNEIDKDNGTLLEREEPEANSITSGPPAQDTISSNVEQTLQEEAKQEENIGVEQPVLTQVEEQEEISSHGENAAPGVGIGVGDNTIEIEFLTKNIEEKNSALKKYKKITSVMREEITSLKSAKEQLIREKMELLSNSEVVKVGSTERELIIGLQADIVAARREVNRHEATIERLKNITRVSNKQKQNEIDKLRAKNGELLTHTNNSKAALDRLKRESETLRFENQNVSERLLKTQEKVTRQGVRIKELEDQLEENIAKDALASDQLKFDNSENERLSAENRNLLMKVAELEKEIAEKPVEEPPMFSDIKVLETKYKLLEGRIESLQEENEKLKKKVHSNKDKGPEEIGGMAGKQLDAMKMQVEDMNHQMSDKKKEIVKLKAENTTMKNKVAELERKLAKYGRKAS